MNDTELWKYVHRLFGVGDWHESDPIPYWEYRALEVHKVKVTRTKRGVTCEELVIAADYCKAHRIDVRDVSWLYKHLADSKRWHTQRQRALVTADLDDEIDEAIAIELGHDPQSPWVDRLIRARGPQHRQAVLDEWRTWRAKEVVHG